MSEDAQVLSGGSSKTLPVTEMATEWSSKLFPNLVTKQARTHGAMILTKSTQQLSSRTRRWGRGASGGGGSLLWGKCVNLIHISQGRGRETVLKTVLKHFFFFWLCWVFVAAQAFSGYSKQGPRSSRAARLLTAVASLVEHRLRMSRFSSCPETCGVCLN